VATNVAIALDASWSPFVTANPIASSTATTSWASTDGTIRFAVAPVPPVRGAGFGSHQRPGR
jgi:hypothetical protein